jgi:hypothetical protein
METKDNNNTQDSGFEFSGERSSKDSNENQEIKQEQVTDNKSTDNITEKKSVSKIQENLPNSGGILAMGILSIVFFCCCWGIIGIALGIVSIVLAKKTNRIYWEDPDLYKTPSYKNMQAGKTTAIIGLSLASAWLIFQLIILIVGIDIIGNHGTFQDIENIWEQTGY